MVCALVSLNAACEPNPVKKVTRLATPAEMPGVPPAEAQLVDAPEAPVPPAVVPPPVITKQACDVLLESACRALGPHSDECQEGRGVAPRRFTPVQHSGCRAVLEEHGESAESTDRRKRLNPCRRLIRAVCRGADKATWECKRTRKDASRLWRTGQGEICLGDLLLLEFKRVLSGRGIAQ